MCFLEFIGYTCGHTSLPVLRPCPLTTASHTFPTCTRRADKPFLAGEMCSACQKIIHSRATQIEEYEHRFMHERGVCGCDTVFPYLIRPRFIGSGRSTGLAEVEAGVDDHGTAAALPPLLDETDADGCAVVSVRLSSLFAAEWVADHRARHEAGLCRCRVDFRTYQQAVAELEEEAEKALNGDGAGRGDEETGPPSVGSAGSAKEDDCAMDDCDIWASHPLFARADVRRTVSSSPPRWRRQYGGGDSGDRTTGRREGSMDGYTASRSCTRSHDRGGSASPLSSPNGQEELQQDRQAAARPTTAAVWLARDVNGINVDGGSGDGNGVRFAGAVFAEVPAYLPITGPFLVQPSPYGVCGVQWPLMDGVCQRKPAEAELWGAAEVGGPSSPALLLCSAAAAVPVTAGLLAGADADGAASSSSSRALSGLPGHQPLHACTRDPLVGFPIGAGPEGASHALPWESRPRCWWRG